MFWILHAASGLYREGVIVLDEETLETEGFGPEDITVEKLEEHFLGSGWTAEALIEASVLKGHLATLPLGNLMERAW